ncbi:hypothetical protein RCL_jg8079.t1 [Rhizophagus clarus]|uniref:Uncharacterized protein n=1 Tax=Rhizophagus clarus TaxID=94130 RepID=A0A8H3MC56_9GLOM|nr:hypothetical protein RCL_jg8079.t1 [Rhizophagus clarus]
MQRQTPEFKLSEYTNEKNSPVISNIKSIYRGVLNSNKLPFIIILAFVDIPNIKHIIRDLLKPKKLSSIFMIFMGIFDSVEMLDEDINDHLPNAPEYDPRVDYDKLA